MYSLLKCLFIDQDENCMAFFFCYIKRAFLLIDCFLYFSPPPPKKKKFKGKNWYAGRTMKLDFFKKRNMCSQSIAVAGSSPCLAVFVYSHRKQAWKLIDSCLFALPSCSKAVLAHAVLIQLPEERRRRKTYKSQCNLLSLSSHFSLHIRTNTSCSKCILKALALEETLQTNQRLQSWNCTFLNIILGMQVSQSDLQSTAPQNCTKLQGTYGALLRITPWISFHCISCTDACLHDRRIHCVITIL